MKYKKQHYIPSSYLKAWCDPNTPEKHEPYVWQISKDGKQKRKKAPKKIFFEKDLYTVYKDDGQRDLKFETNLSKLENKFYELRKNKLSNQIPMSSDEYRLLCMFIAAMHSRTKKRKEHLSRFWQQAVDMGEKIQSAFENPSAKIKKNLINKNVAKDSLTMDDAKELAKNPIPSLLSNTVPDLAPILFKMPSIILKTSDKNKFITSDSPCVWFDPASQQTPKPYGAGGLISPTLEITLPLSPNHLIIFGGKLIGRAVYIPFHDTTLIDNLNKRIRLFSHEYFVSFQGEIKTAWF